jgi:hypothetical protein
MGFAHWDLARPYQKELRQSEAGFFVDLQSARIGVASGNSPREPGRPWGPVLSAAVRSIGTDQPDSTLIVLKNPRQVFSSDSGD